jgi:serine/threonine protein kinase
MSQTSIQELFNKIPGCFIIPNDHIEDDHDIDMSACKMWTKTLCGWYHNSPVIIKKLINPNDIQVIELRRIVNMSIQLIHPNIAQFYGFSYNNTENSLSYVTEYFSNGNLLSILSTDCNLNQKTSINIMLDVAKGMCYMHSKSPPIMHRHIMAANVFIGDNYNAKISNIEFSGKYGFDKTLIGTPAWIAPEILVGNQNYTPKVDVYSFSMFMVELINKTIPYSDITHTLKPKIILQKIACEYMRPNIINRKEWPKKLIELIENCWQHNHSIRPEFKDIVDTLMYRI